jgi:hypothetical protein
MKYTSPFLVALCLTPEAFDAGKSPLKAIGVALSRDPVPFASNSGPAIIRDAIYGALNSRLNGMQTVQSADLTEAMFHAGRLGLLAVIRQLSPPISGASVDDMDTIITQTRSVIDGTPAVDAQGRLLSVDEFLIKATEKSTTMNDRMLNIAPMPNPYTSRETWVLHMFTAEFSIALNLYVACSYLERLFSAKSISFPIQSFAKVMQLYLVSDALDRLSAVFDQGSEKEWLLQMSKKIKDSAMVTQTTDAISSDIERIMESSRSSKDASSQLAALNTQYSQRVERTRVYGTRYQVESRHVRALRWAYVMWVIAYITVVAACVVLILRKQDQAIFILAAVILSIAVISYLV